MRHGRTTAWIACFWLLPAIAGAGEVQVPDDYLGRRVAPLLLLSRPDVQAELQFSAEQAAAAAEVIRDLRTQATALQARAAGLDNPNKPEIVAARRAIDEQGNQWLDARLTPEQRARLDQIDLQWEGPSALSTRASVADALRLSEMQRQALTQAIERRNTLRQQGRCGPDDERVLAEQALAALTTEQRDHWKAMLGPPFKRQPTNRTAATTARQGAAAR